MAYWELLAFVFFIPVYRFGTSECGCMSFHDVFWKFYFVTQTLMHTLISRNILFLWLFLLLKTLANQLDQL